MGEIRQIEKLKRAKAIFSGEFLNGEFLRDNGLMPEIRNSHGEVVFGMDGVYQSRLFQ